MQFLTAGESDAWLIEHVGLSAAQLLQLAIVEKQPAPRDFTLINPFIHTIARLISSSPDTLVLVRNLRARRARRMGRVHGADVGRVAALLNCPRPGIA